MQSEDNNWGKGGKALRELRDRRLYRNTHRAFEEYCQDRFGYLNRRHPYRLIEREWRKK